MSSYVKAEDIILERHPDGDYERFIKNIAKAFIENFQYDLPCRLTKIEKKKSWIIKQNKLHIVKNILIRTLQEEIIKEDLKIIDSEKNEAIKKLQEIIDNAKDDLKYINNEVEKKLEEEF